MDKLISNQLGFQILAEASFLNSQFGSVQLSGQTELLHSKTYLECHRWQVHVLCITVVVLLPESLPVLRLQ